MSRESCITHAAKQAIAIIRADYYRLMERDACGAALLNLFEYWANAAIATDPTEDRPWVGARPIREFEQMLLGISTDKQIRKRLALLEDRGFIQVQTPALRGAAKSYRVMVPEIQRALVGQMTDGSPEGFGHLTDGEESPRSDNQISAGHLTERPSVKQPVSRRSNDPALKKSSKEFKEKRSEEVCFSLDLDQESPSVAVVDNEPIKVGTVTYSQLPESIDYTELWERDPVLAKSRLRQIAPGHKRLEMVAHSVGHWWLGPGLNDFDENLIQACRNRKRKFQQPDGVGDAKTFINNLLRNGDWGNFALRCEEALALRAKAPMAQAAEAVVRRSPFEKTEEERRASALGLARFKAAQGEVEQGRAIAQQFGFSLTEIGLGNLSETFFAMPQAA
ncbi:MAG: hypothetical protein AAGN15_23810 [Cyanobacteria bacterium J06581_3]